MFLPNILKMLKVEYWTVNKCKVALKSKQGLCYRKSGGVDRDS